MDVHPSGYCTWKVKPASPQGKDDQRLQERSKQFWLESGSIYGYRKIAHDQLDLGERAASTGFIT